jgi:hypothetical protein
VGLLIVSGLVGSVVPAGEGEEHVVEVGGMERELGDVDGGLVELAQDAAQGGDVAVGGDLQGEGIAVAHRDVERSGAGELRCGVGEGQVDASAGDLPA